MGIRRNGLFKSKKGIIINADVNAAYNIIRKAIPEAFADGVEGVGLHPVRRAKDTARSILGKAQNAQPGLRSSLIGAQRARCRRFAVGSHDNQRRV
ncbi:MAG: Transposase [Candidatus Alkanophagales archaeon MCA70_species_1]|nr:Transposase [Candidatus Alkanophaga volatiphilum]